MSNAISKFINFLLKVWQIWCYSIKANRKEITHLFNQYHKDFPLLLNRLTWKDLLLMLCEITIISTTAKQLFAKSTNILHLANYTKNYSKKMAKYITVITSIFCFFLICNNKF